MTIPAIVLLGIGVKPTTISARRSGSKVRPAPEPISVTPAIVSMASVVISNAVEHVWPAMGLRPAQAQERARLFSMVSQLVNAHLSLHPPAVSTVAATELALVRTTIRVRSAGRQRVPAAIFTTQGFATEVVPAWGPPWTEIAGFIIATHLVAARLVTIRAAVTHIAMRGQAHGVTPRQINASPESVRVIRALITVSVEPVCVMTVSVVRPPAMVLATAATVIIRRWPVVSVLR